ncbi:MAG: hypothetical protein V4506_09980 [Bacteroidota bacterium]
MLEQEAIHIIKEVDLPEANVALMSDGIMYVLFKENSMLDITLQLKLFATYDEITQGKKVPFLFIADDGVTVTKEARENAILQEKNVPRLASAILVTSLAYKLVANFYLQFNKPKIPYKVFTSRNAAIEWLSQFL